ncbi:hypothetical protein FOZ63_005684 [Perkinsus olseni]|uniref:Uncharacterized protein n=1 Tax=Perkinsus olseni TaxID=32597 RepID=A0A7J6QPI7_PEROL|nr:hypothetical protein FOZ63_005684 [Perkinsus olseni]
MKSDWRRREAAEREYLEKLWRALQKEGREMKESREKWEEKIIQKSRDEWEHDIMKGKRIAWEERMWQQRLSRESEGKEIRLLPVGRSLLAQITEDGSTESYMLEGFHQDQITPGLAHTYSGGHHGQFVGPLSKCKNLVRWYRRFVPGLKPTTP